MDAPAPVSFPTPLSPRLKLLTWAGVLLVSVGTSVIYWPAGLIVAGVLLIWLVSGVQGEHRRQVDLAQAREAAALKAKAQAEAAAAKTLNAGGTCRPVKPAVPASQT